VTRDKRCSVADVVAELRDGMTLGIGGWGSRRKPMALIEAIVQSPVRDLTVVSYGGPDVGMLCKAGKIKKLVTGFVSLDTIPLDPHYRRWREQGGANGEQSEPNGVGTPEASPPGRGQSPRGSAVWEIDEGMLQWGLYAACLRLPFLPTRAGLGSDVSGVRLVKSPYDDGEELVAMPAIHLDLAICHLHRADASGNAECLGPDLFFDDLYLGAAARRFISVERIVPAIAPSKLHRGLVDGVVEATGGAGFTECLPDYPRDEAAQKRYAEAP
jgi:glutaconate CoA-transferase subunit A